MHRADKIGALLREAWESGAETARTPYGTFEAWLAENGDEILAAVAELAQGVRAQEAAKVRALLAFRAGTAWMRRHGIALHMGLVPPSAMLNALARDIEDGAL